MFEDQCKTLFIAFNTAQPLVLTYSRASNPLLCSGRLLLGNASEGVLPFNAWISVGWLCQMKICSANNYNNKEASQLVWRPIEGISINMQTRLPLSQIS